MLSRSSIPVVFSSVTAVFSTSYVVVGLSAMSTADQVDSSVGGSLTSAFGVASVVIGAVAVAVFGIFAVLLNLAGRETETSKAVRALRSTFAVLATMVTLVLGVIAIFAFSGVDKDTLLAALGIMAPGAAAAVTIVSYAVFGSKRTNS